MSSRQLEGIEHFPVRGLCSFCVEAGQSMRGNLYFRSIVFQWRLATGGSQFRFLGDHGGLGASPKRSRSQRNGKQLKDTTNTGGRDRRRVKVNSDRFNVEGSSGPTN